MDIEIGHRFILAVEFVGHYQVPLAHGGGRHIVPGAVIDGKCVDIVREDVAMLPGIGPGSRVDETNTLVALGIPGLLGRRRSVVVGSGLLIDAEGIGRGKFQAPRSRDLGIVDGDDGVGARNKLQLIVALGRLGGFDDPRAQNTSCKNEDKYSNKACHQSSLVKDLVVLSAALTAAKCTESTVFRPSAAPRWTISL